MTEKVLSNKKNGMAMMILWIVLYLVALLMTILGAALIWPLFIIGVVWLCIGWIPFLGLKVLKPQEALVLTLFGKYVGTKGCWILLCQSFLSGCQSCCKDKTKSKWRCG